MFAGARVAVQLTENKVAGENRFPSAPNSGNRVEPLVAYEKSVLPRLRLEAENLSKYVCVRSLDYISLDSFVVPVILNAFEILRSELLVYEPTSILLGNVVLRFYGLYGNDALVQDFHCYILADFVFLLEQVFT